MNHEIHFAYFFGKKSFYFHICSDLTKLRGKFDFPSSQRTNMGRSGAPDYPLIIPLVSYVLCARNYFFNLFLLYYFNCSHDARADDLYQALSVL